MKRTVGAIALYVASVVGFFVAAFVIGQPLWWMIFGGTITLVIIDVWEKRSSSRQPLG